MKNGNYSALIKMRMNGVQRFSFGRILEYNASALDVFWSTTLQLWTYFGVQRFSFGRILEYNVLRLSSYEK